MPAKDENGYETPDPIDPGETVCFSVFVPNSPGHITAFKAQIEMLSYWYSWQRDDAHTGKALAALWYTAWNAIVQGCGGMIRQSPLDPCVIQESDDGGVTWSDVVDMSLCVQSIYPDNNPAGRPQPGEQPGGSTPTPGQCFTNSYTVNANAHVLLPYPIAEGWTISVIGYTGAWTNDNDGLVPWFCPDGSGFFLGQCDSPPGTAADGTFPDPTGLKYELVVIAPDATGHKLRPGVPYTVPTGMAAGNYFLQMNDPDIADNEGSIDVKIEVCNAPGWTHEFDFITSDEGFTVWTERPYGLWAAGGWQAQVGLSSNWSIFIGLPFASNGVVTDVTVSGDNENTLHGDCLVTHEFLGDQDAHVSAPTFSQHFSVSWAVVAGQRFLVNLLDNSNGTTGATNKITHITVAGSGVDPF